MRFSSPEDQNRRKLRPVFFKPGAAVLLLLAGAGGYVCLSNFIRPGEKHRHAPMPTATPGSAAIRESGETIRPISQPGREIRALNATIQGSDPVTIPRPADEGTASNYGGNALTSSSGPFDAFTP